MSVFITTCGTVLATRVPCFTNELMSPVNQKSGGFASVQPPQSMTRVPDSCQFTFLSLAGATGNLCVKQLASYTNLGWIAVFSFKFSTICIKNILVLCFVFVAINKKK